MAISDCQCGRILAALLMVVIGISDVHAVRQHDKADYIHAAPELNVGDQYPCEAQITGSGNCTMGECFKPCYSQVSEVACKGQKAMGVVFKGYGTCLQDEGEMCITTKHCFPGSACNDGVCMACKKGLSQPLSCVIIAVNEAAARMEIVFKHDWQDAFYSKNLTRHLAARAINNLQASLNSEGHVMASALAQSEENVKLVLESVNGGMFPLGKGSSRSGASFFLTKDDSYLVKGFARLSEYAELQYFLTQREAPFAELTTLNIPAFAFPAFNGLVSTDATFWTVMPNADVLFKKYLGESAQKVNMLDAKPEPLISAQRDELLSVMRKIHFKPQHDEKYDMFMKQVATDVALLDSRSLVDYSWLVYDYKMPSTEALRVLNKLPTKETPAWCFGAMGETATEVHVLCFALIDFTLSYGGLAMSMESSIMGDKWDDYGKKFTAFTEKIFNLEAE